MILHLLKSMTSGHLKIKNKGTSHVFILVITCNTTESAYFCQYWVMKIIVVPACVPPDKYIYIKVELFWSLGKITN